MNQNNEQHTIECMFAAGIAFMRTNNIESHYGLNSKTANCDCDCHNEND